MANIMKDVAKLLGLELEEEFTIEGFEDFFPKVKLTERGLSYWSNIDRRWCGLGDIPNKLLTGENKITKLPKPILDDVEKEYLSNIIKPFRNRILYIAKSETVKTYDNPNPKIYECIYIMYKDSSKKKNPFYMGFPCFERGTMYKGMEIDKKYTLEELRL